jgi:hypothetical protein
MTRIGKLQSRYLSLGREIQRKQSQRNKIFHTLNRLSERELNKRLKQRKRKR